MTPVAIANAVCAALNIVMFVFAGATINGLLVPVSTAVIVLLVNAELSHGQHRQSGAQVHIYPLGQSSFTLPAGTAITFSSGMVTLIGADPGEPEPIEDAGIRAGEIVAFRAWRVEDDRLYSVFIEGCEWCPGAPTIGEMPTYGVFAFKSVDSVGAYLSERRATVPHLVQVTFDAITGDAIFTPVGDKKETFAIGAVHLWGQVCEHEHGYRAEFAKVASLDIIDSPEQLEPSAVTALMARLRARYGVAGSQKAAAAEAQP